MLEPGSVSELLAWATGGAAGIGGAVMAAQQLWRKIAKTNSDIKVDTEVSGGTIEIIKLLREQNASAAAASALAASQYETLISTNTSRYKELLLTNTTLYDTINDLQLKVNELNLKIGDHQANNNSLKREIEALHNNNAELSKEVNRLTSEINNLRRGVTST